MADTLEIFGIEYTNVTGIIATDSNGNDLTYTRGGGTPTLQTKSKTYTPTTSQQTESITADSGYDGLSAVNITVNAMPTGTAGTPTATKGTVSNHQVSVTPSVTNTAGYISGGTKTGTAVTVSASELVSGTLSVTSNGTKDVTNYASVDVNISSEAPTIESLSITPSESAQTFNATGVDGYKPVSVDAIPIISDYVVQIGDESFYTENNNRKYRVRPSIVSTETGYLKFTRYASKTGDYKIYNAVASDITITPTESSQTIGGAQYIMEGPITIGAISSTYVGSEITQRSSTDLTVSGATITAPAGYYSAAAQKSVTSGSASAPSSISGTSASVSTGTNTLTLTKTVSVTPVVSAGYVSAGTAGNSSVSLTASVTTKAAATITPSTTNQTIAAGTYLTGAQTIAGDADLVASNIISTANIFGVQGSVVVQSYYTGSSAPASSLGQNGDIYLQE